jgi:transposase
MENVMGRKTKIFRLEEQERDFLQSFVNKGTHKSREVKHAQILLKLDEGKSVEDVANSIGMSQGSVYLIRKRYETGGLKRALYDLGRCGRPVELNGIHRAKLTALACSEPPEGHTRWTMRLVADKAVVLGLVPHISKSHAHRILKKTNLSRI